MQWSPSASHGQTQFPRRLTLPPIHGYKSLNRLGGVEPQRRPEMSQVERSRRGDGRQNVGRAHLERQLPQDETIGVGLDSVNARRVLFRRQRTVPRESNQITPRLEDEEDARQ